MISLRKLRKHLSRGHVRELEGGRGGAVPPALPFRHWVVIPVCDEPGLPDCLRRWAAVLPEDCGMLLVVNHPEDAGEARKTRNRRLLAGLRGGDALGFPPERLFWTDGASPGRELRHGVGEARRIGFDTALAHLDPRRLEDSLLAACDGDALVRRDYWTVLADCVRRHPECGAFCPGVRHQAGRDAREEQAIRRYERYLQEYVDGLRGAGSPYAYHAIGSAIVTRASTYLLAGGMPVRAAGEDFYFLQALRKVAGVRQMAEPLVFPSARPSDRVPFGTGRAVSSLLAGGVLPGYPPAAFACLERLLAEVRDERLDPPEAFLDGIPPEAAAFLERNRFPEAWGRILRNLPRRPGARAEAFHRWFDALRTYRFIHSFRTDAEDPSPRPE